MNVAAFAPFTEAERVNATAMANSAPVEGPQPILPVPAHAERVHIGLERLRRESHNGLWGYTDTSGNHLFFVARWNRTDGSKDIMPVAWCFDPQHNRERWCFKNHPDPRPLYNLYRLAQKPDAPVVVFEGEAKADLCAQVFSHSVGTTSPGGANAAHKADWAALAGRKRVLIWPDANDKQKKNADGTLSPRPGEVYAAKVAALVAAQGVDEILIIDSMALAKIEPNGGGEREAPQGWDIKDALAEGWEPAKLREAAIANAKRYEPAPPPAASKSYISFGGFKMTDAGLVIEKTKTRKSAEGETETITEETWVSAAFELIGRARDPEGGTWARFIRWRDDDSREHTYPVKDGDLHGDGVALASALQSQGLQISRNARTDFLDYLSRVRTTKRLTIVSRSGWHQIDGKQAFVLKTLKDDSVILDIAGSSPFETSGTTDGWRDGVGTLVSGHSRAVLAVSLAFVGPLLRMVNAEGGGFNLFGQSSRGKSTLAAAAASVWGRGANGGFLKSWRTTANALEGAAAVCSDTLLAIDELGTIEAKEAANAIYSLANGQGKQRMSKNADLRQALTWRVPILSTGEIPMDAKLSEDRSKGAKAGQQVRLLDIPADAGKGFGVFSHAGPDGDPAKLSNEIKREAEANYGHAGPAFVSRIIREGFDKVAKDARKAMAAFAEQNVPADADGQVVRVAQRLALIAVAGELATLWGIVPWRTGEAVSAAKDALDTWINRRGGAEAAEITESLSRVRSIIEAHGASRFELLGGDGSRPVINRLGYVKGEGEDKVFLFLPESWKSEVCAGMDPKLVASVLASRGFLDCASDGHQKVHRIEGRPVRVYAVLASILGGGQ